MALPSRLMVRMAVSFCISFISFWHTFFLYLDLNVSWGTSPGFGGQDTVCCQNVNRKLNRSKPLSTKICLRRKRNEDRLEGCFEALFEMLTECLGRLLYGRYRTGNVCFSGFFESFLNSR